MTKVKVAITHPAWTEEFKIDIRNGIPQVPKCPDCHMSASRYKCAFELGGGCGRFDIYEAYRQACKERGINPK